jgi:hypothetical protein
MLQKSLLPSSSLLGRPHGADGRDGLSISREAANMLNKRHGQPTRGGPLNKTSDFIKGEKCDYLSDYQLHKHSVVVYYKLVSPHSPGEFEKSYRHLQSVQSVTAPRMSRVPPENKCKPISARSVKAAYWVFHSRSARHQGEIPEVVSSEKMLIYHWS